MRYLQHPLSSNFPGMSGDDLLALAVDIDANGQKNPITLYEGMVLDGWHRYEACRQLEIECKSVEFPADGDPVAFVESQNLFRRHLTESQRAAAVVANAAWRKSGQREQLGNVAELPPSADQLAERAKVSTRTVVNAKAAVSAGLGDSIKKGEATANSAANLARQAPDLAEEVSAGKTTFKAAQGVAKERRSLAAELAKVQEPEPDHEYTELDQLRDTVKELRYEVEELRYEVEELRAERDSARLGATEEDRAEALAMVADLKRQIAIELDQRRVVESQRDVYMHQANEMKKQIGWLERKLKKAAA